MTEHSEIPEAAVEALARKLANDRYPLSDSAILDRLESHRQKHFRRVAREHLEVALPAIHAARDAELRERLLSDEAVEEARIMLGEGIRIVRVRQAIEAALDSIGLNEGGDHA